MNNNWLKLYPDGMPTTVDSQPWLSLAQMVDDCCQRYADRSAILSLDRTLTFADIERKSRAFAAWLQNEIGLSAGQRIALMMPNSIQYVVTLFGALRAGLTVVNVNPLYTARELEHQLDDSGAVAIVVLENFAATLEKVYDNVGIETVVITRIGDFQAPTKRFVTNFTVKAVKKSIPDWSLPNPHELRQALQAGARLDLEPPEIGPDDLAFLQYTGGTTGPARGAMLSHGNMIANVAQCRAWLAPELGTTEPPIVITALPMYHIFALTVNLLLHFCLGGKNILVTDPRNMNGLVKTMARHPFNGITGVNTLFNGLLNSPGFSKIDFSALRFAMAGGMPVQKAVADRWATVTGKPLIEGYGLSETSPVVACNPLNIREFNYSVGVPLPSTEVDIRDDDDRSTTTNEPGELCVRGPQVMQGYWNSPAQNPFTNDGFFRTGDITRQDDDGRFFIIDRKHDTIVISGFKVYPTEIEDVIAAHPGIKEAACIRVPDDKSGEAIKLFVVRHDPNLPMEDIRAYCREHLTAYKVPKHYEFIAELPKSNVGKILRKELR